MTDSKKQIKELVFFLLYIAGFVFLCSRLVVHQPAYIFWDTMLCPPDEADRYLIPRFIFEHGRLPFGWEDEVGISGYGGSYAYLPGLSYIFMSVAIKFASLFTGLETRYIFAARMVNLIMGVVSATFVWALAKRLFKDRPAAKLLPVMFMYLPQMIFIFSYVNLDACGILSIVIMSYFLLAMGQDGVNFKNSAGFAVGAVFCLLSYYNCYAFFPGSVMYFIYLFIEKKDGKLRLKFKEMMKYGCFILLICFIGAGWWFIRSAAINKGDFLGLASLKAQQLKDRARVGLVIEPAPRDKGVGFFEFLATPGLFFWLFISFVADYGATILHTTKPYYLVYAAVFAAGIAALIAVYVYRALRSRKDRAADGNKPADAAATSQESAEAAEPAKMPADAAEPAQKPAGMSLPYGLMLICGIIFNFGLWMFYAYAMDFQRQGRYVLPSALAFFIFICCGYDRIELPGKFRALKNPLIFGIAALLILLCLYFIFGIALPAYSDFTLLS